MATPSHAEQGHTDMQFCPRPRRPLTSHKATRFPDSWAATRGSWRLPLGWDIFIAVLPVAYAWAYQRLSATDCRLLSWNPCRYTSWKESKPMDVHVMVFDCRICLQGNNYWPLATIADSALAAADIALVSNTLAQIAHEQRQLHYCTNWLRLQFHQWHLLADKHLDCGLYSTPLAVYSNMVSEGVH